MIRVTVELLPNGDESKARTLAVARIVNIGGTPERGDYRVTLSRRNEPHSVERTGLLTQFERTRGPWELLHEALRVTLRPFNPGRAKQGSQPGGRRP